MPWCRRRRLAIPQKAVGNLCQIILGAAMDVGRLIQIHKVVNEKGFQLMVLSSSLNTMASPVTTPAIAAHNLREPIRREQTLICYGLLACLQGLKEQGCNGPVTHTGAFGNPAPETAPPRIRSLRRGAAPRHGAGVGAQVSGTAKGDTAEAYPRMRRRAID